MDFILMHLQILLTVPSFLEIYKESINTEMQLNA